MAVTAVVVNADGMRVALALGIEGDLAGRRHGIGIVAVIDSELVGGLFGKFDGDAVAGEGDLRISGVPIRDHGFGIIGIGGLPGAAVFDGIGIVCINSLIGNDPVHRSPRFHILSIGKIGKEIADGGRKRGAVGRRDGKARVFAADVIGIAGDAVFGRVRSEADGNAGLGIGNLQRITAQCAERLCEIGCFGHHSVYGRNDRKVFERVRAEGEGRERGGMRIGEIGRNRNHPLRGHIVCDQTGNSLPCGILGAAVECQVGPVTDNGIVPVISLPRRSQLFGGGKRGGGVLPYNDFFGSVRASDGDAGVLQRLCQQRGVCADDRKVPREVQRFRGRLSARCISGGRSGAGFSAGRAAGKGQHAEQEKKSKSPFHKHSKILSVWIVPGKPRNKRETKGYKYIFIIAYPPTGQQGTHCTKCGT